MTLITDFVALLLSAFTAVIGPSFGPLERRVERSFEVAPGSAVAVDISGGSISVTTGPGRTARLVLVQRVEAASEREADEAIARYSVSLSQAGDQVRLATRRKNDGTWGLGRRQHVNMNAELIVPADVRLDLDTSGGSIGVRGDRTAEVSADTAGGSISVDGGRAAFDLDTSGGSIRVGHALSVLRAHTSGGSITVGHVGASARDVVVQTSGGSIRVGVAPDARLTVDASTSGGSVSADALPLNISARSRSALTGTLNGGGGGRLHAATSGGSVSIRPSQE